MKNSKIYFLYFFICCVMSCLVPSVLLAAEIPNPNTYIPTISEIKKHKAFYDDPRPYLKTFGPKQVLPKELYEMLTYDVEKMKNSWAEAVGFKAPDLVGKIAPEIKPGKYTYKDLEKYPGFKELMYPDLYKRIKPGGPPHAGNIPEFEIIPTRQYYYALPLAETTNRNIGKTKLDDKGYLIPDTWEGGYPFPRPSGNFKTQQIMYNVEKRYLGWGLNYYLLTWIHGYTKNLRRDFEGVCDVVHLPLSGRVWMKPYQWFDERAKKNMEFSGLIVTFHEPRDLAGTMQSALYYLDPNKADQLMVYVPSLRRVRKLTATDSQDPMMGQDQIYDDNEGFMQKLSPTRYPYKYELLEEREYLVVAPTEDGAEYWSSKGLEMRNVRLERRPFYVVKLTQLDPNYVYGKRILYIDKETFNYYHVANYDQKGRLYRTGDFNYGWFPEMGAFGWCGGFILFRDHLDLHCGIEQPYELPAFYRRGDIDLGGVVKSLK